ncbi:alpha/beta fold hydrolase [Ornithinimicrobium pekingense]|uniref:AB hydrolase-1 domain-containing protein n=1 Tax=Ornithinimicrobium pekingense TaxID=384677 RepID=A0ABQ2F7F2_9MICO|nr:alpha/beta hydrolase [Ornithinimicrobium pekingense]GGK60527.1 hypothetical protein GCM10011509_06120 [Ornithinimicrobium pekingense]
MGTRRTRTARWAVPAAAAVAATAVGLRRALATPPITRRWGVSSNGMEYEVLGDGPRTLLFLPGGPGSEIPSGRLGRLMSRQLLPYVRAGYAVWQVTRRRHMPPGHTVSDMADDYARFVEEELGGHVDLVVGESYGGVIAPYLAANHPHLVGRVVMALAAATITDRGKELDVRWATARAEGRHADAGEVFLEYVLPGEERAGLRRRLGPLAGRVFARSSVPAGDLLVEAEAEAAFDCRDVLSRIEVPVLLACGDRDEFFTPEAVRETARRIPGSTLRLYEGKNHMGAATSGRIPRDVLAWVAAEEASATA